MTDTKMLTCILEHTAGAVYSLGDTIIFEALLHNDDKYMKVVVQYDDIMFDTYIFKSEDVPTDVMQIYDYVKSKSIIRHNILLGPHILRNDNRTYALTKLCVNIGQTTQLKLADCAEYDNDMFARLLRNMKHVKQL